MDWSGRAMAINKALERKHQTFEELQTAYNKAKTLNKLWEQNVTDEKGAEKLISEAYPQYPIELTQAIVKTLLNRAANQSDPHEDTQPEEIKEIQNKKWKYWEDVEQEKIKGLTQLATDKMDKLLIEEKEQESEDGSSYPSKRKRERKKKKRNKEKRIDLQF